MSLETWREEFYPVEPSKKMTKRQAVEHSLKKWQGLSKGNLNKHKVYKEYSYIKYENDDFRIDGFSCALCYKYLDYSLSSPDDCKKCPLFKTLGHPCDKDMNLNVVGSPYNIWRNTGNPRPMIKALKQTLESL